MGLATPPRRPQADPLRAPRRRSENQLSSTRCRSACGIGCDLWSASGAVVLPASGSNLQKGFAVISISVANTVEPNAIAFAKTHLTRRAGAFAWPVVVDLSSETSYHYEEKVFIAAFFARCVTRSRVLSPSFRITSWPLNGSKRGELAVRRAAERGEKESPARGFARLVDGVYRHHVHTQLTSLTASNDGAKEGRSGSWTGTGFSRPAKRLSVYCVRSVDGSNLQDRDDPILAGRGGRHFVGDAYIVVVAVGHWHRLSARVVFLLCVAASDASVELSKRGCVERLRPRSSLNSRNCWRLLDSDLLTLFCFTIVGTHRQDLTKLY
jgi:hypothetical protein